MYIQRQGKTIEDIVLPGINVQVLQELRKETLKNVLSKTMYCEEIVTNTRAGAPGEIKKETLLLYMNL